MTGADVREGTAPTPRNAGAIVVKLGGEVLEGAALARVAADLRDAGAGAPPFLLVHGGGPQVTALSERLGLAPQIVGGRRITDAATLDVVKMVVAGKLNLDLVAALRRVGVPAVGVDGVSGIVRARRRPKRVVSGGGRDPIDFGFVGDIEAIDVDLLRALQNAGCWPVLACLAATAAGEILNINADVVASRLAGAVGASALVLVTAVGGVRQRKDDPSTRIGRLTVGEARAAIADGRVQGGMIPKLEEAFEPLAAGVASVHIVAPGEVAATLRSPGQVGTLLVP